MDGLDHHLRLSAADHARNLLGRYCERIDAGDFDGVGQLFAHGSLADEHGQVLAAGAEAVAALYRSTTRLHGPTPRTKHLVLNTVVEDTTGGAEQEPGIWARSSFVVLQALGDLPLQPIIAGRYHDRFVHAAAAGDELLDLGASSGGWRFAERRFTVDLTGDLARHLLFEL
jgi:hypothetical protein